MSWLSTSSKQNSATNDQSSRALPDFAEKDDALIKNTAVYLPPNHAFHNGMINVVLWFHGFSLKTSETLSSRSTPAWR